MLSLAAFADEFEGEKARQRAYDAMVRKAMAGHARAGALVIATSTACRTTADSHTWYERSIRTQLWYGKSSLCAGSVGASSASPNI
jgi:hypothetical protein